MFMDEISVLKKQPRQRRWGTTPPKLLLGSLPTLSFSSWGVGCGRDCDSIVYIYDARATQNVASLLNFFSLFLIFFPKSASEWPLGRVSSQKKFTLFVARAPNLGPFGRPPRKSVGPFERTTQILSRISPIRQVRQGTRQRHV